MSPVRAADSDHAIESLSQSAGYNAGLQGADTLPIHAAQLPTYMAEVAESQFEAAISPELETELRAGLDLRAEQSTKSAARPWTTFLAETRANGFLNEFKSGSTLESSQTSARLLSHDDDHQGLEPMHSTSGTSTVVTVSSAHGRMPLPTTAYSLVGKAASRFRAEQTHHDCQGDFANLHHRNSGREAHDLGTRPELHDPGHGEGQGALSTKPSRSEMTLRPKTILVLSNAVNMPSRKLKNFLAKHNVHVHDDGKRPPTRQANYICVISNHGSVRTAKVLRSLVANKSVVKEKWMHDSFRKGSLQRTTDYVPGGLQNAGNFQSRHLLFERTAIVFTPAAASWYENFCEICNMLLEAGADRVEKYSIGNMSKLHQEFRVVFIGLDDERDQIARRLLEERFVVYDKRMLAQAILDGQLDLDSDEYKVSLPFGKK